MAFIHRAQFSWFLVLGFIILLTLKLDGRINDWNWFIIFIPMWIFDSVVVVYILIKMIMHCKDKQWHNVHETSMKRKIWCMSGILLKLLFQILMCLKLQYFSEIRLYFTMIPFWIFSGGLVIDVFTNLLKLARRP